MLRYVIVPYEVEIPEGSDERNRHLPLLQNWSGLAAPATPLALRAWREVEILGNHALALVQGTAAKLIELRDTPGVIVLPDIPVTTTLGELTRNERLALRDLAINLGYTIEELRQWAGRADGDIRDLTLRQLLVRLATRRLKPRRDQSGDLRVDGDIRPCNPIPLPIIAGGAFGDNLVLVDDFTTFGDPPGSFPNDGYEGGAGDWRSDAGILFKTSGGYGSCYDAAVYNREVEIAFRLQRLPGNTEQTRFGTQMTSLGTSGVDGYRIRFYHRSTSTESWILEEVTNGIGTTMGSGVTYGLAVGECAGFGYVDATNTFSAYWSDDDGANWTLVVDAVDTSHIADGGIMFQGNNTNQQWDRYWRGVPSAGPTSRWKRWNGTEWVSAPIKHGSGWPEVVVNPI